MLVVGFVGEVVNCFIRVVAVMDTRLVISGYVITILGWFKQVSSGVPLRAIARYLS